MRRKSPTLTEQELEIMKLVWQLETCTVRQVYEALLESRAVAYTTVMTMMKILEEKKYLDKHQEGRAYVYQPTKPKVEVLSGMVQEFVDRVFNGSIEPLVLSLMRDKKLSKAELEELAQMIEESEDGT